MARFAFLVNAYQPGHFHWESYDMIRKLLLVGMLTLVQQGSVLQVCAGLATSFVFFATHVRAPPLPSHPSHKEGHSLSCASPETLCPFVR